MKKVVLVLMVMVLAFSGCESMKNGGAVDKAYSVGKKVYIAGKKVAPLLPIDEKTMGTLKEIDGYATTYDGARTVVRKALADEKKLTADTNSTERVESSLGLSVGSDQNITKEIQ